MTTNRYTGTIYWSPDEDDQVSGDVAICFLRPNEIVLELFYENRKYDAILNRQADVFTGAWSTRDPDIDTGQLSCIAIRKGEDVQLSGDWREDTRDYKFRADLQPDDI